MITLRAISKTHFQLAVGHIFVIQLLDHHSPTFIIFSSNILLSKQQFFAIIVVFQLKCIVQMD